MLKNVKMKICIYICDDEKPLADALAERIEESCKSINRECHIQTFQSGIELLECSHNKEPDAVFLDIDMPDVDGIKTASVLRRQDSNMSIFFVTNKDDLVFQTLQFKPLGFIRKTRLESEIDSAVRTMIDTFDTNSSYVTIPVSYGKNIRVRTESIRYIESLGHSISIYCDNVVIPVQGSLDIIDDAIGDYGFIRMHTSFLVYSKFIDYVEKSNCILLDGTIIPLSRRRCVEVKQTLQELSRRV